MPHLSIFSFSFQILSADKEVFMLVLFCINGTAMKNTQTTQLRFVLIIHRWKRENVRKKCKKNNNVLFESKEFT